MERYFVQDLKCYDPLRKKKEKKKRSGRLSWTVFGLGGMQAKSWTSTHKYEMKEVKFWNQYTQIWNKSGKGYQENFL